MSVLFSLLLGWHCLWIHFSQPLEQKFFHLTFLQCSNSQENFNQNICQLQITSCSWLACCIIQWLSSVGSHMAMQALSAQKCVKQHQWWTMTKHFMTVQAQWWHHQSLGENIDSHLLKKLHNVQRKVRHNLEKVSNHLLGIFGGFDNWDCIFDFVSGNSWDWKKPLRFPKQFCSDFKID